MPLGEDEIDRVLDVNTPSALVKGVGGRENVIHREQHLFIEDGPFG